MYKLGKKVKDLLKERKITQKDFSKMIGETPVNLTRYLTGSRKIPHDVLVRISKQLNISIDYLSDVEMTHVSIVPIVGNASCGDPNLNIMQDLGKTTSFNSERWNKDLYCVIANGNSMSPEIDNGDEVIIDPTLKPLSGDTVLYRLDNEYAIKVLVIDKEAYIMQFVPYNSSEEFKTRTIRLDDEETLQRLTVHKVVSVNKLMYNNRAARLKMIGR